MHFLKIILPSLFIGSALADEITLEAQPFSVSQDFSATVLPSNPEPIRLGAEAWTSFKITKIAEHGSELKKGAALIVFDTEGIDRKLIEVKHLIATTSLNLAAAELNLKEANETSEEKLAREKRSAERALESFEYFKQTDRAVLNERADESLKRYVQFLESTEEELKQLLQMYEADDITEETEEIILKKQKDSVARAKFALRMEQLDYKRTKEIDIPNQEIQLREKRDDTARKLKRFALDSPRSIELINLEVTALKRSLKRQKEQLADLEKDRALFEITAPADGTFYYGAIDDGRWITGDRVKNLFVEGIAPINKDFGTFVPAGSKLSAYSFVKQEMALSLKKNTKGSSMLVGQEEVQIPVTVSSVASVPSIARTYLVTLSPEWPEESAARPGQKLKAKTISYSKEDAISVPEKALRFTQDGWKAEVKLADGETEWRKVTRGKVSGTQVEITNGLEAGQVIITP